MLQIHTNSFMNIYSPYDLRGTNMPSEQKSGSIDKTCLSKAGSSGESRAHRGSKLLAHRARDGKAMLQIHMYSLININRPYDLLDTIMPSADKAERLISTCLTKAGPSGYLGPGIAMRILE